MRSTKKMTRMTSALLASVAVVGGLAACSTDEAKDNVNKATDAAGSAAAEATQQAGEAADKAKDSAKDSSEKASESEGAEETMSNEAEDVAEADVPESISTAAQSFYDNTGVEAGAFVSAKKLGDATMAEYENVTFVESPETNGPQPVVGKIRETWVAGGALANKIGLPTEAERVIDKGWEQKFTKDTMQWTSDNGQDFSDSYLGQQ